MSRSRLSLALGLALLLFPSIGCVQADAPESTPVSAAIINPRDADSGVGEIEVTLANGSKKIFSHGNRNGRPHVSARGDVGWTVWNDVVANDPRVNHTGETLRVRLRDGTIRDFKPNSRFIMDWSFADDGAAVVMQSMGFHGSSFFIKYSLKSRAVLGRVDDYVPYDQLPAWAKPFSDEKPQ